MAAARGLSCARLFTWGQTQICLEVIEAHGADESLKNCRHLRCSRSIWAPGEGGGEEQYGRSAQFSRHSSKQRHARLALVVLDLRKVGGRYAQPIRELQLGDASRLPQIPQRHAQSHLS